MKAHECRQETAQKLLSLLAIFVQFGAYYLLTPAWALTGMAGAALPLCIVLVGLLLWVLARRAAARGWLR